MLERFGHGVGEPRCDSQRAKHLGTTCVILGRQLSDEGFALLIGVDGSGKRRLQQTAELLGAIQISRPSLVPRE